MLLPRSAGGKATGIGTQVRVNPLWPSPEMQLGQRTGKFRLGCDSLLFNPIGRSSISVQDYAVAMIDELERPAHIRQQFTFGY